jgi:hypothetical protein
MTKIEIETPIRNDRCIRTSSGIYIDVFEPTEDMITIEDIAHSLSHQCRYGGHLPVFYSVAQHSIYCCENVEGEENKLSALLHDASEAYLLDMPRPIKYHLADYRDIEDKLMRVIATKFGFEYPLSKEVKVVDEKALHWEWDLFFSGKYEYRKRITTIEVKHLFLKQFRTLKT